MNISENELIARFMGGKWETVWCGGVETKAFHFPGWHITDWPHHIHEETFRYHDRWDELMPVVEKIKSLKYRVEIHLHYIQSRCEIYGTDFDIKSVGGFEVDKDAPLISHVYKAVVSFIKWYENQK